MEDRTLHDGENVLVLYKTLFKTLFFDLPLAGVRHMLEAEQGREAAEAAWKTYDEGVRLATAAIDNLYRDPHFGEALDHSLQGMLRWQHLSKAFTGAVFRDRLT
jgi:hypothetical protein